MAEATEVSFEKTPLKTDRRGAAYQQFERRIEGPNRGQEKAEFHDGLFACCARPGLAVKGLFCVCCVAADNYGEALRFDGNCNFWLVLCCYPIIAPLRRGEIRRKYQIDGTWMNDCLVHLVCPCCAQCQERRHYLWDLEQKAEQSRNPSSMS
uniref:Uncharacterized protein n=1 Tax=Lotharella oceanica TaxID=641309 RepID=A0A7S2XBV3_9EUKA|eukprot:CAMPEP_0170166880 /NCGR_PEP_ID=MMETSP0040_2-20121228/439_1 /TAXON_ID=641309 /ORGANISM="Lotharella oceanica, Strain CCMP622" /LENGTH=151 /DNA_ID=CAMNT_0010404725 /DNA_START=50 /DNA_END=505 /DNA_ORIENTATION=+